MAIVAIKGYYIEQMDIVTAFLYGPIEEEVYVEQSTGFSTGEQQHRVCKLNKALYGLKQSPRAWYKTISATLSNLLFVCSQFDHMSGPLYNGATTQRYNGTTYDVRHTMYDVRQVQRMAYNIQRVQHTTYNSTTWSHTLSKQVVSK